MTRGDICDAAMKLDLHDNIELRCELERPHREHQSTLRDYAFDGSITLITWYEDDRRNYHGDWPGACEDDTCPLPYGHRGAHAT